MGKTPPKYVLVAGNDDDKEMVAKLIANLEEEKKNAKKAQEDKEEMEAKLKAIDEEDKVEHAKKAVKAALDAQEDEEKKDEAKHAIEEIFETQGTKKGKKGQDEEKKEEETAVTAAFKDILVTPMINNILAAKKVHGASEESLTAEKKILEKLPFTALKASYDSQEIYIKQALSGKVENPSVDFQALVANYEGTIPFNGIAPGTALTGKAVNIDEALEEARAQ